MTLPTSLQEQLQTPVVHHADVIVCGGGPAGIAAALSAARQGARTVLLEMHGCLGGVWTAGILSCLIDHIQKPGIMAEIQERLKPLDGLALRSDGVYTSKYDSEAMKLLLDEMALEAGVHVQLHTRVVSARTNADNRLTHVVTESKSGREAWSAKVFIDTTGDGDLAFHAGCGYSIGREDSGETQPMSLMAVLTGLDPQEIAPYFNDFGTNPEGKDNFRKHLESHGHTPTYSKPTLFRIHDNLFAMMANHQYGVSGLSAADLTKATMEARAEIHKIVRTLKRSGSPWDSVMLVATAAQIGVREARRIKGRYTVSVEDLREGRSHPDAICKVNFGVDIHSTNPNKGKDYANEGIRVKPYDIPLRAAIAADVDGLMMAGRCISGDFFAHASYRVTGNAVAMGENVGTVAAYAATHDLLPQEVAWQEGRVR